MEILNSFTPIMASLWAIGTSVIFLEWASDTYDKPVITFAQRLGIFGSLALFLTASAGFCIQTINLFLEVAK